MREGIENYPSQTELCIYCNQAQAVPSFHGAWSSGDLIIDIISFYKIQWMLSIDI